MVWCEEGLEALLRPLWILASPSVRKRGLLIVVNASVRLLGLPFRGGAYIALSGWFHA